MTKQDVNWNKCTTKPTRIFNKTMKHTCYQAVSICITKLLVHSNVDWYDYGEARYLQA